MSLTPMTSSTRERGVGDRQDAVVGQPLHHPLGGHVAAPRSSAPGCAPRAGRSPSPAAATAATSAGSRTAGPCRPPPIALRPTSLSRRVPVRRLVESRQVLDAGHHAGEHAELVRAHLEPRGTGRERVQRHRAERVDASTGRGTPARRSAGHPTPPRSARRRRPRSRRCRSAGTARRRSGRRPPARRSRAPAW